MKTRKTKESFVDKMSIIYWVLKTFCQMFLTPQMKGNVIITNKQTIYELPQKLLNNLRNIRKFSKLHGIKDYKRTVAI